MLLGLSTGFLPSPHHNWIHFKTVIIYHEQLSLVENTNFLSSSPRSAIHLLYNHRQVAEF